MANVLIKEGYLDADGHLGKMSYEDEDRDQGDISTNQGTPKMASELPEAWAEPWSRRFLTASEVLTDTLISDSLASTTVRKHVLCKLPRL